ncbi:hypothetical protein PROFUN_15576 [Planoprotostelium fungivorum]|uniref:Ras guanine nucleotide exchange factor glfB-like C-terminal domain-containing protein n=1 Tax=Planoprotostelium fungivorum TaxID=1890364 RepID=A0A2P6MRJ8_9EUKA|nr:hypothetical protein PROFUN_15576 [Planoprotostelium fungivorum]
MTTSAALTLVNRPRSLKELLTETQVFCRSREERENESFDEDLLQEYPVVIKDIGGSTTLEEKHQQWFTQSHAFIFVFSVADVDTLAPLLYFRNQIQAIKKNQGIPFNKVPILVVGTNVDRPRKVAEDQGVRIGQALGCPYYETSSYADEEGISRLAPLSSSLLPPRVILTRLVMRANESVLLDMVASMITQTPEKEDKEEYKTLKKTAARTSRRIHFPERENKRATNVPQRAVQIQQQETIVSRSPSTSIVPKPFHIFSGSSRLAVDLPASPPKRGIVDAPKEDQMKNPPLTSHNTGDFEELNFMKLPSVDAPSTNMDRIHRRSVKLLAMQEEALMEQKTEKEKREEVGLLDSMRNKWSQPLRFLPVGIDLPRLATKIQIIDGPPIRKPVVKQQNNRGKSIMSPLFGRRNDRKTETHEPQPAPTTSEPIQCVSLSDLAVSTPAQVSLNIKLWSWSFSVMAHPNSDVKQLMGEISSQATKKMNFISNKLDKSQAEIELILQNMKSEVNETLPLPEKVLLTARTLVQTVKSRIEDAFIVSVTQPPEHEQNLQIECDMMREIEKRVISAAIATIRSSRYQTEEIKKRYNESLRKFNIEVENLRQKSRQLGPDITKYDIVSITVNGNAVNPALKVSCITGKKIEAVNRVGGKKIEQIPTQEERSTGVPITRAFSDLSQPPMLSDDQLRRELENRGQVQSRSTASFVAPNPDRGSFIKSTHPLYNVINQLFKQLNEPREQKFLEGLEKICNGTGDTSRQLTKHLEQYLSEESRVTKVLKCINQSIVAAPFLQLREAWPVQHPFEDDARGWSISVNIVKNQEVVITHRKRAIARPCDANGRIIPKSADDPQPPKFIFFWEVVLRFDWEMNRMTGAAFKTTDLHFEPGYPDRAKKRVTKAYDMFGFP